MQLLECVQFIHAQLNRSRQVPTAPKVVASSANFEPQLVESARQAVFLGRIGRVSVDFDRAFALGQTETSAGKQIVFTRFLSDKQSSAHVSLYEHHLLLTWQQFLALGGNTQSLANYFYRRYPENVAPTFSQPTTLPSEIEVAMPSESVRLATLWSRLKPLVGTDLLIKLLLALFEAERVSINGLAQKEHLPTVDTDALALQELLTLLLPLSWRPHLTFATQLFEPERSPARLRFSLGKTDQIRLNLSSGEVWREASLGEKIVWPVYIEEVVTLLTAQAFDELSQYIGQIPLDAQSQLGTPHQAMRIYRLWEPVTEERFLSRRLKKNQVTPQRLLYLLQAGRLQAQEKARGLASLTKTMLAGHFREHARLIPRYIADADATIYRAQVSQALPEAPLQAKALFQTWLQAPAFREEPACRELTCDLVAVLAGLDFTQALDLITTVWATFPPVPPVSRSALFATCARLATTIEKTKHLILWRWQLGQETDFDMQSFDEVPGLNQLPLTKRLLAHIAGTEKGQPKGQPEASLLYQAYREEWNREPRFLFGIITFVLDKKEPELQVLLWDEELVHLAQQATIRQVPAVTALLTRFLDTTKQQPEHLIPSALKYVYALAYLFDRFEDSTIALLANLSNRHLTTEWLAALQLLTQKDADWKQAQIERIVTDPKWSNRPPQIRFDDCLRVADALDWSPLAYPAIKQMMQLLQDAASEITIYSPRSQHLLDWLLEHDPANSAWRQLLIRYVCRDALRGDILWSEVVKRLLNPPVSPADLTWFHDNLQALLGLTLSERSQTLEELDRLRPSTMTTQRHAILDDAINNLHASWLLEYLQKAHLATHLPPLKRHRPSDGFVQLVAANCYAQPSEARQALLEWHTRWQGLNWVANTEVGVTFLANVIQSANQEGFIPDTIQLIAHLERPRVRQHLLEACNQQLTNQLYQTWSWDHQNNKEAEYLIEKVAEYIVTTLDPTPITILGKESSSADPKQLYILLQTYFKLWEALHTKMKAELPIENKTKRGVLSWFSKPPASQPISQELKHIYAKLGTAWMTSMTQLCTQRQNLPESWKCSLKDVFNMTHQLFREAGQAYGYVFKAPSDLDEFMLLALQFAVLHSVNSTLEKALSKHIDNLLESYHCLIKHGNNLDGNFDYLLIKAFCSLLNEGVISAESIIEKSYRDEGVLSYNDNMNEAIRLAEMGQIIVYLRSAIDALPQIHLLNHEEVSAYFAQEFNSLDPRERQRVREAMQKLDLLHSTLKPVIDKHGF